ncbi:hypothetical protein GCM10010486_17740 [Nonomuraea roseoviolacea subsp. carminata]
MDLHDYHGPHAAPREPWAESVEWERSVPRAERLRVREHTCWCQRPHFELCTAGGLWFVRRMLAGSPVDVVETSWMRECAAKDLWHRILSGQAR